MVKWIERSGLETEFVGSNPGHGEVVQFIESRSKSAESLEPSHPEPTQKQALIGKFQGLSNHL